jgi:hypothetical protein
LARVRVERGSALVRVSGEAESPHPSAPADPKAGGLRDDPRLLNPKLCLSAATSTPTCEAELGSKLCISWSGVFCTL